LIAESDIDRLDAVTVIKRRLCEEAKDDVLVDLAAHNRLDLKVESWCFGRPGTLFSMRRNGERRLSVFCNHIVCFTK
jgi:hypothetical protein